MRHHFSIIVFVFSCGITMGQNLILNSNFETNGQLNCDGWYDGCQQALTYLCDTLQHGNSCDIQFVKDAPPGGGVWSLDATGIGNGFPATASTYITGLDGTHYFLLKAWMKDPGQAFGGVNIGIRSKGTYELHKTVPTNNFNWAFYSMKDTLTLESTDSIQISLSAFAAGPAFGDIYFDQVEYILLDSLTSVPVVVQPGLNMASIYPNPVNEFLTFRLQGQNVEHSIYIYSLTGQLVQTVITSDQNIVVDANGWESGLYFYKVENTRDRRLIGAGKFLVDN